MTYLNQLTREAEQIREATDSKFNLREVQEYIVRFGGWTSPGHNWDGWAIWDNAVFESSVSAEASFFLALHGFYEEACTILRVLLDGFLYRLYWNTCARSGEVKNKIIDGRSTNDYCEWEYGRGKYPWRKELWDKLRTVERIRVYDSKYNLEGETNELLSHLDKFAHGRAAERFTLSNFRSSRVNVAFNEQWFGKWYEYLRAAYRLTSVLSILQYPELLEKASGLDFTALQPTIATQLESLPPSDNSKVLYGVDGGTRNPAMDETLGLRDYLKPTLVP